MYRVLFLRNIFITVSVFTMMSFCDQIDVVSHCKESIEAQDHQALLAISADQVVFEKDDQVLTVDKVELNLHLADFFISNPIKSFNVKHEGGSEHGTKYMIASYLSEKGKNFILKVKFLNKGGDLKISTIKFSPE